MRAFFNILTKKHYVVKYANSTLKCRRVAKTVFDYCFLNIREWYFLYLRSLLVDKIEKIKVIKLIDLYQMPVLSEIRFFLKTPYFYKKIGGLFCQIFFSGYIIKRIKGGFIVDLNGLICFMPSSFADIINRKSSLTNRAFREIQIFKKSTVNISYFKKDNNFYFNWITSRRQSFYFLKKLLRFFNYSVILGNIYSFNSGANIRLRHKVIRAFIRKKSQNFFLQYGKEFLCVVF